MTNDEAVESFLMLYVRQDEWPAARLTLMAMMQLADTRGQADALARINERMAADTEEPK